ISNRDTEAVIRMHDGIAQLNISLTQTMAQISKMAEAMSQLPAAIEGGFRRISTQSVSPSQPATGHQTFQQLFQIPPRASLGAQASETQPANSRANNLFPGISHLSTELRSDRISQIISNWKIRFSGSSSMSVDD
ncbi:hypothetical protein KR059_010609, partial [Drosophila kikkawai]